MTRNASTDLDVPEPIRLIRSAWQPDDLHSATRLSARVAAAELLRVRRGIYVDADAWVSSPPWIRAQIAVAAMAHRRPNSLFCRESALLLHGLPLTTPPPHVTLRTQDPSLVGIGRREPMTGTTSAERWLTAYETRYPHDGPTPAALLNVPTRRFETVLPRGMTRGAAREAQRCGELRQAQMRLPASVLPAVTGPETGYWVEPLELALPDAVSRLDFPEAVAVVDAFLAQRTQDQLAAPPGVSTDPLTWGDTFLSPRLSKRWRTALSFADARAESPGESVSRAVIHQLGFAAPNLQVWIGTDVGDERVDFEWIVEHGSRTGSSRRRIVGEFDGLGKYFDEALLQGRSAKEVHYAEKLREDAIRRTGRGLIRWDWTDLSHPEALAAKLLQAGVPRVRPAPHPGWLRFPVRTSGPENATTQEEGVSSG
ncbi:hypothetical protein [Nesterenkonia sandarakina]|uniref:Transcriptional regulator, AbiEi antitoxin, Type IV TA system n=1 Tax=Nesterenkonia sandarakina TaxID=272918 RepID=A0A2T0YSP2_9MICC|nr:hypothetical protein [Nesterenkonia sandarakina]PRZ18818.1 Transcriptional regulator, AbiEi antitoxin, Type IV TA system [Nesterenkonia sandarakina]